MIFPFAVASVTRIESKLFSASTFSSAMLVLGLPMEDSIVDAIFRLLFSELVVADLFLDQAGKPNRRDANTIALWALPISNPIENIFGRFVGNFGVWVPAHRFTA